MRALIIGLSIGLLLVSTGVEVGAKPVATQKGPALAADLLDADVATLPYFDPTLWGLHFADLEGREGIPPLLKYAATDLLRYADVTVLNAPVRLIYSANKPGGPITGISLSFDNATPEIRLALSSFLAGSLGDFAMPIAGGRDSIRRWYTPTTLIGLRAVKERPVYELELRYADRAALTGRMEDDPFHVH